MEDFIKALEAQGVNPSWLMTLALWYIGWNLRTLKTAPGILTKTVSELIKALNDHSKTLREILERKDDIKDEVAKASRR